MTLTLSEPLVVYTPCKINLRLYVQGKRPDGYHELSLDFIPLNLLDQIRFVPAESLSLTSPTDLGPWETNLVIKAVRALETELGEPIALRIELTKEIPHGAGLGGGSANAAGTLVALNKALDLGIAKERLLELARPLGADVPFFIEPRPMLGEGIGEKLTPVNLAPDLGLILLYPGFPIATAEAYRVAQHSQRRLRETDFDAAALSRITPLDNDFFEPLSALYPDLKKAEQALQALQPDAVGFSGSGSCLFALFVSQARRNQALPRLKLQAGWRAFAVEPFYRYPYL